jgi:hypothetical protein
MAIRIANVDPQKAQTEFVKAYTDPGGVMRSNADNAQLQYAGSPPNDNPIYSVFHEGGRNDQAVSRTVTDTLTLLNDPRLPVYADPRVDIDTACGGRQYCGQQNGTNTPADFNAISPIGKLFKETPTYPSVMMTYSEVLFLEAEAAQRGWIAADPAALYRQAITASMQQYGIDAGAIATYLAQPSVAYNGLPSIFLQKWIALYGNGPEQFAELRRSAYVDANGNLVYIPYVTPAPTSQQKRVPLRLTYPAGEQSTNSENVLAAIQANGGGTLYDHRVWWNTVSWEGQNIATK